MDLCGSCHEAARLLFPRLGKDKPEHLVLERHLPKLDHGSYNDCWMCYRLAQWLKSNNPEKLDLWIQGPVAVTYKYLGLMTAKFPWLPNKVFAYLLYMFPEHGVDDRSADGEAFELTALNRKAYEIMLASSQRVASPQIDFSLVQKWIDMCSTHRNCREPSDSWLPSRLLEITNNGTSAKLVLTEAQSSTPTATRQIRQQYITLSHRWGNMQYKKLSASTIEELRQNIAVTTLPQVFQEAFIIANRLGISLIWVDSLCIMQDDDKQDWKVQCQLMHRIYANAFLNISATGCDSDQGSLLQRGSHTVLAKPQKLKVRERLIPRKKYIIEGSLWVDEIVQAPLNSRGWVFQERHLARRVLHFGTNQMAWECRELDALETCPSGLPPKLVLNQFPKHDLFQQLQEAGSTNGTALMDLYASWRQLVQNYSCCNLTKSEDKLPALRGLADLYQKKLNDEYVAGIWKKSLLTDLAWHCDLDLQENTTNRAPSWSWASVDGEITFPYQRILGLRETYVTDIKFGNLVSSLACNSAAEDNRTVLLIGCFYNLTCQWDNQKITSFSLDDQAIHHVFEGTPSTGVNVSIPLHDFQACQDLKFLPLFASPTSIYGLVLSELRGHRDSYRRLGCIEIAIALPFDEINGKRLIDVIPGDWFEHHTPRKGIIARKASKTVLCNRTALDLAFDIPARRDQLSEMIIH